VSAARKRAPDPGTICRELCQLADAGELSRLTILAPPTRGEEETWFSQEVLKSARAWAQLQQGIDFLDIDAGSSDFKPEMLDGFLQAASLFAAGQRVLIMSRAGKAFAKWPGLSKQLAQALKSGEGPDLVLIHLDGTAGSKAATALKKSAGDMVRLERFRRLYSDPPPWRPNDLDASEAAQFVQAEARRRKLSFQRGAAGCLVQIAGGRPAELCQALDHFALLQESNIGEETVREVVAHSAEGSAFAFADAILSGNGRDAFRLLVQLRARGLRSWDGRRISPQDAFSLLVSVLAGERRKTDTVGRCLAEGLPLGEACKQAGVAAAGPPQKRMERRLQNCDRQHLQHVLQSLHAAEVQVKIEGRGNSLHCLEQLAFSCHRSVRR